MSNRAIVSDPDRADTAIKTIFRAYAYGQSKTFDNHEAAEQWIAEQEIEQEEVTEQ
jgi:hypothetical protein